MRKELASGAVALGLAIASIGSASCQRLPQEPQQSQRSTDFSARPAEAQKPIQPTLQKEHPISEWKTFSSSTYPYKVNVPPGWSVSAGEVVFGKKVDFLKQRVVDGFLTNINILVQETNQSLSLDQYAQTVTKNLAALGAKGEVSSLLEVFRTTIAGREGRFIVSYFRSGYPQSAHVAVIFNEGNRFWEITLSAHPSVISQETQTFNDILHTFSLRQ